MSLAEAYGKPRFPWLLVALPVAALGLGCALWWRARRRPRQRADATRLRMPEAVNAFTVLGLLRQIQRDNQLGDEGRRELAEAIARIERHYFARPERDEPDLRRIAQEWVARAS